MTTTITTRPPVQHGRRRTVLAGTLVAALALGAGVAAGRLTSFDGASTHQARPVAAATTSDVDALWNQLSTMSVGERNNVVAGLSPSVRARLEATGLALATALVH